MYLAAVVFVEFDDFRKVVIDGIKFKILFPAPFDSFRQSFTGAAGPENEFVAVAFPFLEIFNQCMVGLTKLRPFAVTQGTVKINSDGLEIQLFFIIHSDRVISIMNDALPKKSKENLNPDIHEKNGEENKITIPEGVDPELLMKVLGNPEMAALLTSLAKTMKV